MSARTPRIALAGLATTLLAAAPLGAGFDAENVALRSQITPAQFGTNFVIDCWGYVSPSGREYAIVGVLGGTAFVEITDPDNPVIVEIVRPGLSGQDVKVYQHYAYANSDSGALYACDMSDIDNGTVTLIDTFDASSHNLNVDEESGFLYLAVGGPLLAFDLADPAAPVFAGIWPGETHDVQVVTYTDGEYAGRQIAFVSSGRERALKIVDVTDKKDMFLVGSAGYPNSAYTHQGWLSADRQYFYMNDEGDQRQKTEIFDVSDLANPVHLGDFSSNESATDHNLYWRDGFIFEANYTSGLRVFDACDPEAPFEVGYFDTYPQGSGQGFNGAWSNYPFFPSGMVIVSDTTNGLFVLDVSAAVGEGCPGDCAADFDDSGDVGFGDLLQLLAAWGPCPGGCAEDLDGDEDVDFQDLLQLLAAWGPC